MSGDHDRDRASKRPRASVPGDDALLVRIDDALRHWPEVEQPPYDWDEAAASVQARVEAGEIGSTSQALSDDVIFASPLCVNPEELQNSAAIRVESSSSMSAQKPLSGPAPALPGRPSTRSGAAGRANPTDALEAKMGVNFERERDRRSFQDLARLASSPTMTQPPPSAAASSSPLGVDAQSIPAAAASMRGSSPDYAASKDDSGLIDLRAMSASEPPPPPVATAVPTMMPKKPASTLLASTGLFEEETSPPSAAVVAAPLSLGPMPTAPVEAPAVHQAQQARINAEAAPKKSGSVMLFGGLFAAAAIAAGVFFVGKSQKPADATAVVVAPQPIATVAPAAAAPVVVAAATPGVVPPVAAIDPASLPAAADKAVAAPAPGAIAAQARGAKVAAHAAANGKAAKADEPAVDPSLVATNLPVSPGVPGSLGEAMKQAAGPSGDKQEAAAEAEPQFAPGSVPQKPSLGAVSGALGTVLPAARSCLGPDDPISRATVTFKSSGAVSSVTVTGNAAGRPAEACIKAALLGAKVPPFAQDTYPTPVTIRPN